MALAYKKLPKYPHSVRRLLGIEMNQLHSLVEQLTPSWEKQLRLSYRRFGRPYKHDLGSNLSSGLWYFNLRVNQEVFYMQSAIMLYNNFYILIVN